MTIPDTCTEANPEVRTLIDIVCRSDIGISSLLEGNPDVWSMADIAHCIHSDLAGASFFMNLPPAPAPAIVLARSAQTFYMKSEVWEYINSL